MIKIRRLRGQSARYVVRPGRRGGTTLVFFASAPARLTFVVLGAPPECRVIGSFSRQVRKGINRIRFSGRLRGQALKPGTYTLVTYVGRGRQRQLVGRVALQVFPANRRLTAAERRRPLRAPCAAANSGPDASGALSSSSDASTGSASSSLLTSRGSGPDGAASVAGVTKTQIRASTKDDPLTDLPLLSSIIPEDAPVPPLLLAVLALVAIGLGSLALIAFVLRYFRGSWNP